MQDYKPFIGISMGDPAGVGPEITLKTLSNPAIGSICRPIVIGDAWVLEKTARDIDINLKINPVSTVSEAAFEPTQANVLDLKNVNRANFQYGQVNANYGKAAFEAVKTNIELALAGEIDATVTGPIHKESINLAGFKYAGHTEIYAHYTNTKKYAMLLVEDNFRVIHVSTHVSLRAACDLVKKERVVATIELIAEACRSLGVENPKIGIAGLNPHASDGGLFGHEEKEEIIPAIEQALAMGYRVEGPIPPDTLFPKAIGGYYDGCVVMYHDQGHIPFKVVGFQWDAQKKQMKSVRGVNITLGLPIIRTSVDHGTAMEIAGQGVASPDAMQLAIEYAIKLFENEQVKLIESTNN